MDIVIDVEEFECEAPSVNLTYRVTDLDYLFNWYTDGDIYESYGLIVTVKLFYQGDNDQEQEYIQPLPFIADNYQVTLNTVYDKVDFRFEFYINSVQGCHYIAYILYDSIIII